MAYLLLRDWHLTRTENYILLATVMETFMSGMVLGSRRYLPRDFPRRLVCFGITGSLVANRNAGEVVKIEPQGAKK